MILSGVECLPLEAREGRRDDEEEDEDDEHP